MIGLIFFVQVVHYPLFAGVGSGAFRAYHALHEKRTTWVVVAPMLLELGGATGSLWWRGPLSSGEALCGWGLVVGIWVCTALVQVPQHRRLSAGFDSRTQTRLVCLNWIRTVAWSARGVLLAVALTRLLA